MPLYTKPIHKISSQVTNSPQRKTNLHQFEKTKHTSPTHTTRTKHPTIWNANPNIISIGLNCHTINWIRTTHTHKPSYTEPIWIPFKSSLEPNPERNHDLEVVPMPSTTVVSNHHVTHYHPFFQTAQTQSPNSQEPCNTDANNNPEPPQIRGRDTQHTDPEGQTNHTTIETTHKGRVSFIRFMSN